MWPRRQLVRLLSYRCYLWNENKRVHWNLYFNWWSNKWWEGFYVKRKEGERKQGSGGTERERACVCVCVRWLKPTTASISIHNSVRERNTSVAINDCLHLWSISEDVWEFALMRFLSVGLLFSSDIWISDSLTKRIASLHSAN